MLEARYVEETRHEDGSVSYKRPLYAEVMFRAPEQVALLEELGYRFVKEDLAWGRCYYARPWPLWAVLRLYQKGRETFWAVAGWLYHHGVFHFRTPEQMRKRWRDLGLGPNPQRRKSDG